MSFSNDIRQEIVNIKIYDREDMISFLRAVFAFSSSIVIRGKCVIFFSITTESFDVAKKISYIFKKIFSITLEIYKKNNYNFGRSDVYVLECPKDVFNAVDILKNLSILEDNEEGFLYIKNEIDEKILSNKNLVKSFLRGTYLVCGSVTNPEKNYHLEFTTRSETLGNQFCLLLNKFNINANIVTRKDVVVVYVKESESISDFLNIVGAHNSMFKFEDIRIEKNVRNNVNRIVNCETANLSKIARTYIRHKTAIEYIINKKTIDYLPDDLKEIAILRLENEDDSLQKLGERLSNPISKSGVNHRLNKIELIAKKIKEEELNDKKRDNNSK